MKSKRNNVGLCPFLPMTSQNLDSGMEKCEMNLSEKCEKYMFVLASCWSINIVLHINGGVGSNPIFSLDTPKFGCGDEKIVKK